MKILYVIIFGLYASSNNAAIDANKNNENAKYTDKKKQRNYVKYSVGLIVILGVMVMMMNHHKDIASCPVVLNDNKNMKALEAILKYNIGAHIKMRVEGRFVNMERRSTVKCRYLADKQMMHNVSSYLNNSVSSNVMICGKCVIPDIKHYYASGNESIKPYTDNVDSKLIRQFCVKHPELFTDQIIQWLETEEKIVWWIAMHMYFYALYSQIQEKYKDVIQSSEWYIQINNKYCSGNYVKPGIYDFSKFEI